ncbi:stress response nst1-like [Lecanosticta acicola]|uniref:Stress response nst1-like n=1 Tax=Lecanosticta acicola TaxID=111012 RepID=A0AAI8YUR7_9PEZI|nr:stress response nst1-like [Lecanosticta acicola]
MPKERSINPAAQQRKADKQKEIARNKKHVQNQRNEKLAKRNPERLQKQIDELKESEARGVLRPKDKDTLAQLERDLRGVRRAREALGDAAPKFPSHERRERHDPRQEQRERRQNLGKRRREEQEAESSDSDPEARDIPMPRDTPPPIPRQERRPFVDLQVGPDGQRVPHALPAKPAAPPPPQLVYTSAPQIRDLKKEATRFVPSVVAQKKKQSKGQGRLLEPEEIDRLEKSGYYAANKAAEEASLESRFEQTASEVRAEAPEVDLDEEMRRFEEEMKTEIFPSQAESVASKNVQMEEVDDDGN